MGNKNRINILKAGIMLLICMLIFLAYGNSKLIFDLGGIVIKKSNELNLGFRTNIIPLKKIINPPLLKIIPSVKDTMLQKIILIGDSEIEGLMYPFNQYCLKNGHQFLLANVCYSATDNTYANTEMLSNIIKKYQPNYVVMVIGLNQTFQTNLEESDTAVKKILKLLNGVPYSWIGPASWVEDKGINEVYQNGVDSGCFYMSKKLVLGRGKDGRHPSAAGYQTWMDSIANWMDAGAKWRLKMSKPDSNIHKRNFTIKLLNAATLKN